MLNTSALSYCLIDLTPSHASLLLEQEAVLGAPAEAPARPEDVRQQPSGVASVAAREGAGPRTDTSLTGQPLG